MPLLDDLHARLHPHERSLLDAVFKIPARSIDENRSRIELGRGVLKCDVVAVNDAHVPFFLGFSRPEPGYYVFYVGPGVSFATWEEMRHDGDAQERRYEVEGVLRSRVRVDRYVRPDGQPVKAWYHFNALSYGDGPAQNYYRWRYAPFSRLTLQTTEYAPWLAME